MLSYGTKSIASATLYLTGWLALASHLAAAIPNVVTVYEKSGASQVNYPVQFARPFADNEIQHFPQAIVNCGSGSSPVKTQADIKQRYASGFVKHAILSF